MYMCYIAFCLLISLAIRTCESVHQSMVPCPLWRFKVVYYKPAYALSDKVQFFGRIVVSILLFSAETWAVVKQQGSPLTVFQMNCLQSICICGVSLRETTYMPNVVILSVNRCNTLSVESQLQSNRLRWLGHTFRIPGNTLPKELMSSEVKGLVHLAALDLVPMIMHYVTGKTVILVGLTKMHKIKNNNLQVFQLIVLARYLLGVPKP